jgi:sterol desaturase/sphingolipid hydroxylase (fatty acid hydroxylase superfamily)
MHSNKPIEPGGGVISGTLACFLAILSFLGVISFHFPEYTTTPDLRAIYDVEVIRYMMFGALVMAGSLGMLNFFRGKSKRLGLIACFFVIMSIILGGHRVEVGDFADNTPYLGLDWFILDLLGSSVVFILFEKLLPFRNQSVLREHWQTDLNHFLLNHLIVGFVLLASNMFVHTYFSWAVNTDIQSLIKEMPFILELFIILLAADLVQYWSHRAYHEIPILWRLHAVHHSIKNMDWLAGSRQHIIEIFITRSLVLVPVFVMGFSKEVIDIYVIIVGFQAVFNHANVQVNFGPLKYIFVTPQFHHWHHSSDEAGLDKNYALHFSFLDYLFGTAVKSKKEWPDGYGVVGDYVPDGIIKQQAFPFTWDDTSNNDNKT